MSDPIVVGAALRDDDGPALELARALAGAIAAPLVLFHAYPFQPLIAIPPPAWVDAMRADAAAKLGWLALGVPGARTLCRANPSPVRALHEAAEELGAQLLVVGSSHHGPAGRVTPGSVAERLLHASPCPVAIAPRGYVRPPAGLRRIGVAYADGPQGAAALELAAELARSLEARVITYTVVPDGSTELAGLLGKARAAIPAELLLDTTVLHGDTAAELAAVTGELDLLVTGSRGYGAIRSLMLGGVSARLAHTARCPLLVVPHEFRTSE